MGKAPKTRTKANDASSAKPASMEAQSSNDSPETTKQVTRKATNILSARNNVKTQAQDALENLQATGKNKLILVNTAAESRRS